MDSTELALTGDITKFIVDVDKLQRATKLKDDVLGKLSEIRNLKNRLDQAKSELKDLMTTEIKEDETLTDLLNEINTNE